MDTHRPRSGRDTLARCAWVLAAALAATAATVRADGPTPPTRFSVSTGFDYSRGDYGEGSDTEIWYVPLGLKVEHDPWTLRITVPYLRIRGPGGVVGGGDGTVIVGDGGGSRETNEGLGDVVAGLSYVLPPPHRLLPFLELTGKVKFPTASRSGGLGTGQFDGTLQLDASRSFGALTPFATLGYRFLGDPPGTSLHDTAFASLGLDWRAARHWHVGLIYDWRQTASRSLGNAQELIPYASRKFGEHVSIGPYGVVGLSRAAADFGVGLQITLRR